jgi:hypothetical protein
MSLDSSCMPLCWICSTLCDLSSSCVLLGVVMYHWMLCNTMDRHNCVLLNDIVLISMENINSVENDYQLDG